MRSLPSDVEAFARSVKGFMPADEGRALFRMAQEAPEGPLLEVGSYCGKSAVYLGTAAKQRGSILFSVDHHRGSEENQAGWEHHDTELVDSEFGIMDTLPFFRRTLHKANLEGTVVAIVGESVTVASHWSTPLALLFIDGGHGSDVAHADFDAWTPHVAIGGLLAIHDVFADPGDGGRPPFQIYRRAVESGHFEDESATGSLRVLRRVA